MGTMSSLSPPAFTVYQGVYTTVPLLTNLRPNTPLPPGGNQEAYCPLQFDWSELAKVTWPSQVSLCFLANIGLAPNALKQIACLVVDNSYNDFDIHIQFIDGFTLTIPAWEPMDVYPVITASNAFYIWCDPPTITPPSGFPITGRRMTTNIFACNANIPPIRAKKLSKQVFVMGSFNITGTFALVLGDGILSGLTTEGVLKSIIINDASAYSAGSAVVIALSIDNVSFTTYTHYAPGAGANDQTNPFVIPDLNIRCSRINGAISSGGTVSINLQVTAIFEDHSGTYGLT